MIGPWPEVELGLRPNIISACRYMIRACGSVARAWVHIRPIPGPYPSFSFYSTGTDRKPLIAVFFKTSNFSQTSNSLTTQTNPLIFFRNQHNILTQSSLPDHGDDIGSGDVFDRPRDEGETMGSEIDDQPTTKEATGVGAMIAGGGDGEKDWQ